MISLDDFIAKYDGKQVEVAGSANALYQCVDLANAYIREVLGNPIIEWTDAKDFPSRVNPDSYDFFKNTPEAIIKKGDICVWTGSVGSGHGHIAICIQDGELNSFVSFDQNWSTPLRCKIEGHTYLYVNGWLRPKGGTMDCLLYNTDKDKKTFAELVEKSSKYDSFVAGGFDNVGRVNQLISEMRDDISRLNETIKVEKERADGHRQAYNEFIAMLASKDYLDCVQEPVEILAQAKKAGTNVKDLEDLKRAYGTEKEEWTKTESNLKAEIARLEALLKQENVLRDVATKELIKELIARLYNVLRHGK